MQATTSPGVEASGPTFTQVAHGFEVGTVLKNTPTGWAKSDRAQAVVGILVVSEVVDADRFTVALPGRFYRGFPILNPQIEATVYQGSVPGTLTCDRPAAGQKIVRMGMMATLEEFLYYPELTQVIRRESRGPQEEEIDGSWDMWVWFEPEAAQVKYQIYYWLGENLALTDRTVEQGPHIVARGLSEAAAQYDPATQLYTLAISGLEFQYSKVVIEEVGNVTINPPAFAFRLPNGSAKFTNLNYTPLDSQGVPLSSSGQLLTEGENLTLLPFNPNIARIRFELTPITGNVVVYEVVI
jgi:hypothetical protein